MCSCVEDEDAAGVLLSQQASMQSKCLRIVAAMLPRARMLGTGTQCLACTRMLSGLSALLRWNEDHQRLLSVLAASSRPMAALLPCMLQKARLWDVDVG